MLNGPDLTPALDAPKILYSREKYASACLSNCAATWNKFCVSAVTERYVLNV
jgi:hypothetical protein